MKKHVISSDFQTPQSWLKKTLDYALFFNPLLSIWKLEETHFPMFDILPEKSASEELSVLINNPFRIQPKD